MQLKEYQKRAMDTCMASCNNWSYMFLNLVGEVGEFASKVAKHIRKRQMQIGWDTFGNEGERVHQANVLVTRVKAGSYDDEEKWLEELKKEAGDILWQLSGVCTVLGWSLEEVAQMNLDKLAARKAVGTIDGNGDGIIRDK